MTAEVESGEERRGRGESEERRAVILLYGKMDLVMFDGSYRIGNVWAIGLDWIGMAWLGISLHLKWLAVGMEWRTHQFSPGPGGRVFFGYFFTHYTRLDER